MERQREARVRLFRLAAERGALLAATGTHPWSPWQEQQIIDTEHYRRVADGLQYVAWRNNTFSLHVHVGVRGAERAVRVCDRLRPVLPELLALSANSPFLDGRLSGLHSARTQIFTKSFPRCGIPDAFGSWTGLRGLRRLPDSDQLDRRADADLVERAAAPLVRHGRAAHLRRPDERGRLDRAGGSDHRLRRPGGVRRGRTGAVRRPAGAVHRGELLARDPLRPRRPADRHPHAHRVPGGGGCGAAARLDRARRAPSSASTRRCRRENGAQRQRRAFEEGATMQDVYAAEVAESQRTYAAEEVSA